MSNRTHIFQHKPIPWNHAESSGDSDVAASSTVSTDCLYSTVWMETGEPAGSSLPGSHVLVSSSDVDVDLPQGWVSRVVFDAESLADVLGEQAWGCVAVLSDGRESDVAMGLRVLQMCSEGKVLAPDRVVLSTAGADDSGLWGLARTARLEHPDLAVHCIQASREQLLAALRLSQGNGLEEEYRFTGTGALEVPRLQRYVPGDGSFVARPDVTYVVSGGLGALGLVAAEFLVDRGARHLVLLSRSAGAAVPEKVSQLRQIARVECVACDVSDLRSVRQAQEAVSQAGMPSVAGLVHAAGVLTDGVLANQSGAKLKLAYGAKVRGARNLRSVFAPLEFLVLFSSAAATFGSAGQGSYAAANATLDALAESWSARGERVLSIQWGAWSDAGMAVRHDAVARAKASGFGVIDNELGTAVLGRLLGGDARGTVCVSPIDWDTLGLDTRFVSSFTTREPTESLSPAPKLSDVRQAIRTAAWEAVGKQIDDNAVLLESGLDSLGSISLRNRIASDLKVSLPAAFALESPDIGSMVRYVFELMQSRRGEITPIASTRMSSHLPVLVVGAGVGGIGFARRLEKLGVAAMVMERRDHVGGVWSTLANTYSKLQIDSPAYSFDSVSTTLSGDHRWGTVFPGKIEVLQQAAAVSSELKEPINFNCELTSVRKIGAQEYEAVYIQDGATKSVRVSGVAAFTGGLHRPVEQRFPDEHRFAGHVGIGMSDDTPPEKFLDASVVIVGHGAFALENMRTALESGARHVTIICRRRNLVVSTLCNWMINSSDGATTVSDVVEIMRPFYHSCGIDIDSLPSLSQDADGSYLLDQSTVPPASDLYFLAQKLGKVTVIEDEVATVSTDSITTTGGRKVAADVLVKCLGSHTDQDVLLNIFGAGSRMEGLWVNGDANLFTYNDGAQIPRKVGSLLCSSYVFFLQAFAEAYLHFRDHPAELESSLDRISSESSGRSYTERVLVELWDFIEPAKKNVASRTLELCPFDRFQREREAEWQTYAESFGDHAEDVDGLWDLMSPTMAIRHRREPGLPVERRVQHARFGPVSVLVPHRHRVLFLPGQGTDARLSRALLDRTGWTKREDLEFVIPDAPFAMPAFTNVEQLDMIGLKTLAEEGVYDIAGSYREWNAGFLELWNEFYGLPISAETATPEGALSSTLPYIRALAEDHGPFAGIAGFCEGAAIASAALHRQAAGHDMGLGDVRFFIAMSAWRSPIHERAGVFEKDSPIEIPVLQTVGEKEAEVFLASAPIFGRDFHRVLEHRHLGQHVYPPLTRSLDQKLNRLLHGAASGVATHI
ncbi:SDR family NAD(P)-dependent oxidoreductase [Nocardia sp. NPDC058518]|uniref:SDR family NAD(P)-dependent oxidoreductase n=1 Tax=Nocardia sp. NPDC058518 TaxID=3346534 RepID=UPI0036500692